MSPSPQDGLHRLEPRGAIAAESDRRLGAVDQARVHVQREMGGAELEYDLSGQLLLTRGTALGKRLHPRLDALEAPDVGERPGTAASLGAVELACGRAFLRAARHGRGSMPAAVAASGRHEREHGDGERESPSSR
jgi:hypothetical protein